MSRVPIKNKITYTVSASCHQKKVTQRATVAEMNSHMI